MGLKTTVLLIAYWAWASLATAQSPGMTYQGRLIAPDGSPVETATTQFRFQIRTPPPSDCLLYEETKNVPMSNSNGFFKATVNDGSGSITGGSMTLDRVFSNRTTYTFAGGHDCGGGLTYNPGAADGRRLLISFNDGTFIGWEALPTITLNHSSNAIEALQVGGFKAANLLRVQSVAGPTGVPQNVDPLTLAQYNKIMDLLDGTSLTYEKLNHLNGEPLPLLGMGESLYWDGTAWVAYTPLLTEADPTVESFAQSPLPTCAAGHFLRNDGTGALECVDAGGGGGGSVSIVTGTGLTGGPITSTGTIELESLHGSAGSAAKVNYDVHGRVTGAGTLLETDLPTIDDPGKVVGGAITSGTIGGSTAINTSGNITTTGEVHADSVSTTQLLLRDTGLNTITFEAPALGSSYVLVMPTSNGNPNQVLSTDGNGILSWVDQSSLTETDPKVGTLINTKWCTSDGTQVICNSDLPPSGTGDVLIGGNTVLANMVIGTDSNHALEFETNGTTKMTILENGNVGIGTASPEAKLNVVGNDEVVSLKVSNNSSTTTRAAYLQVENFRGSSSGEAAINVANYRGSSSSVNPTQNNDFLGAIQFYGYGNTDFIKGASISARAQSTFTDTSAPTALIFGTTSTGAIAASEKLRLTADGNVGIGTTSPARPLHVAGPMRLTASTVPSSPALGDVYVDSGDSKLKYYDGTGWVEAGGSGGGGTVTAVTASGVLASSGGNTPDISLNIGEGLTTVSSSLTMNLGNGLEFNSGAVRAKAGDAIVVDGDGINVLTGTVSGAVMAADGVPHCDADQKLEMGAGPVFNWTCVADLGITSETDPKVGTLTNTKWCTSDGSQVICNSDLPASGTGDVLIGGNTVSSTMVVGTNSNHSLAFETNGSTKMTVLADGKVGIGTTTPAAPLDIRSPAWGWGDTGYLRINTSNYFGAGYGGFMTFGGHNGTTENNTYGAIGGLKENGTVGNNAGKLVLSGRRDDGMSVGQSVVISSIGRMGISKSEPDARLHIVSTTEDLASLIVEGSMSQSNGTLAKGVDVNLFFAPPVSTTDVAVQQVKGQLFAGAGVNVTNFSGLRIHEGGDNYGAGTITNGYGLYVKEPDYGTNKYTAYFEGRVGIGTATPTRLLDVAGPMRITASTVPGSPALGDIYVDTGDSKLKYYDGTQWVEAGGSGGGGGTVTDVTASGVLASSGGNTPDISLNIGEGLTTVSSSLTMNLGNGLEFNSGAVRAKAGDAIVVDGDGINVLTGTVSGAVMAADGVPHCDPDQKLEMGAGPVYNWTCVADLGITSETDPKVGTLTNTKWCTSDGTQVICNSDAPGGAGDVLIGGNTVASTMTIGTNSNHDLAFETNGTTKMTVLANGNVGIGTTSPSIDTKLHLHDTSGNNASWLQFSNNISGTTQSDGLYVGLNNVGANIWQSEAQPMIFATSDSERMRLTSGGNLGIGDTSADAKLEVVGDFMVSATANGDGNRFIVNSSGNVGIGTAAPDDKLTLAGTDEEARLRISNFNSTSPRFPGVFVVNVMGSGGHNGAPSFAGLQTRGTAAVTAPVQTDDHLFQLSGSGVYNATWDSRPNAQIVMVATETHSASAGGAAISFRTVENGTTSLSQKLLINHNGNVGIGTAEPNAKLTVQGAAVSRTNIIASGATVNLSLANNHLLKAPGTDALVLQNPVDGGVYTLVIADTTSRNYSFSGCTNSYFSPARATTSNRSTYTILVAIDGANTECYITWITGFN